MNRFDRLRAEYPHLGMAVYCLEPGDEVALEVILPDYSTQSWKGPTLDSVLDAAFGAEVVPDNEQQTLPAAVPGNVFD